MGQGEGVKIIPAHRLDAARSDQEGAAFKVEEEGTVIEVEGADRGHLVVADEGLLMDESWSVFMNMDAGLE